jgi:hypothetical protein
VILAAASSGEKTALLVIGVLGVILSISVYAAPGVFDAATRWRLRLQGLPDNDEHTLARDRSRRRFIAMILGVLSAAILAQTLAQL